MKQIQKRQLKIEPFATSILVLNMFGICDCICHSAEIELKYWITSNGQTSKQITGSSIKWTRRLYVCDKIKFSSKLKNAS